jgi:hypothetical protein
VTFLVSQRFPFMLLAMNHRPHPGKRVPHHILGIWLLRALGASTMLILSSLGLGTVGYHYLADLSWIDALYNAAMILTGMGPVAILTMDTAKLFASTYALFSGVVFVTAAGIMVSPLFRRVLHHFHIDRES